VTAMHQGRFFEEVFMNLPRQSAGVIRNGGVRAAFPRGLAGRWPYGFGVRAAKLGEEKCGNPGWKGTCQHIPSEEGEPCSYGYCGADRYIHRMGCECPHTPPKEKPPTRECSRCVCVRG
jgi:hypothetical protein